MSAKVTTHIVTLPDSYAVSETAGSRGRYGVLGDRFMRDAGIDIARDVITVNDTRHISRALKDPNSKKQGIYRRLSFLPVMFLHNANEKLLGRLAEAGAEVVADEEISSEEVFSRGEGPGQWRAVASSDDSSGNLDRFNGSGSGYAGGEGADGCWHFSAIGLGEHARKATKEVAVGVIDFGFDPSHPLLHNVKVSDYVVIKRGFIKPFVDHGPKKREDTHPTGHGTQITSLIAGQEHGVAPNARLVYAALEATNTGRFYVSQLMLALDWMYKKNESRDQPLAAVNMSLALDCEPSACANALVAFANKDIMPVAASGNRREAFPGKHPSVIAVGATRSDGRISSLTVCTSSGPQFFAPGEGVVAAGKNCGVPLCFNGTSYASAILTGAAALVQGRGHAQGGAGVRSWLVNNGHPLESGVVINLTNV